MNEPGQQKSDWVSGLRQSNALGWVAFALLIVAVLVGALTFGRGPEKVASETTQSQSLSR
jgi:hypothetical protein